MRTVSQETYPFQYPSGKLYQTAKLLSNVAANGSSPELCCLEVMATENHKSIKL